MHVLEVGALVCMCRSGSQGASSNSAASPETKSALTFLRVMSMSSADFPWCCMAVWMHFERGGSSEERAPVKS